MKNSRLFVLLISMTISIRIYSQEDTLIDFENKGSWIEIDTSTENNIWQIGQPSKNVFNYSYSGKKAILTDSLNNYPVNCKSAFILKIDSRFAYSSDIAISFWHKYETTLDKDFGKIDYSYDGGLNWQPLNDTNYNYGAGGHWYNRDSTGNQVWGGNFRATGSSPGWIFSQYSLVWYYPSKSQKDDGDTHFNQKSSDPPDSLYLRFLFLSDSVPEDKSGWMIDNIEIYSGGLSDIPAISGDANITIFPNPTSEFFKVQYSDNLTFSSYSIYSINGQKLKENKILNRDIEIDVSDYKKGLYYITFYGKDFLITKSIIIK